jgi:hypothetical protein
VAALLKLCRSLLLRQAAEREISVEAIRVRWANTLVEAVDLEVFLFSVPPARLQ